MHNILQLLPFNSSNHLQNIQNNKEKNFQITTFEIKKAIIEIFASFSSLNDDLFDAILFFFFILNEKDAENFKQILNKRRLRFGISYENRNIEIYDFDFLCL